jgi:hypothetical protein
MGAAARALGLLALFGAGWLLGVAPFLEAEPRTGISRDLYAYFFPRFVHVGRSVAAGVLPLWNPWELCGVPFLASGQSGALSPLVVLAFGALPPGPALAVHLVLHFFLCGALLYGLARALGLGTAGASVAAVVWTFSPALTNSVYHPNRIGGLVWMPVVFWLGAKVGERGGGRWAAPLAVALALQMCGGYPEFALDTALLLGLALAAGLGAPAWDARRVGRGLAWLAVAGAVALLVAGLQIVPTLEMVGESAREATAARPRLSPGPAALVTLFGLRPDVGLVYLGMVPAFYVGAAPLLLAVVGAVVGRRGVRAPFLAGAAACVLAVVAFDWLHLLPFYRHTRFPLPWALILPFFLAMLAGAGLDALVRAPASRALGLVGTACVLVLLFGTATSRAFALVALAGAAFVVGTRAASGLAAGAVVALTVAEVIVASPFRLAADPFPPLRHSATTQELLRLTRAEPEPVRFVGEKEAARGVAMLEQVDSVTGLEESAMPRRLRRIVEHFGMNVGLPDMALRLDAVAASKPLLDLLGIAYVAGPARWAAGLEAAGLVPVQPATGLWRNPAALPRAFLVRRVRSVADADAAFAAVSDPGFRPREEAIVEEPIEGLSATAAAAGESARVVRRSSGELVVAVDAASPALLVVTETHYPGWTVRVGGAPAAVRRVDFAFRGVVVPAGRSEVTFAYAPRSVWWGAAASASGLVLAAALWLCAPRARHA